MLVNYNDYPTQETRLIAHMLDFSLTQASRAVREGHMVEVCTQLSAAAAYAGVLSVLLHDNPLGWDNAVLLHNLTNSVVECVRQASFVTTPN